MATTVVLVQAMELERAPRLSQGERTRETAIPFLPATWTELVPEGQGVGSDVPPEIALGPPLPPCGDQNLPLYNY
jgi:hypothetical protein